MIKRLPKVDEEIDSVVEGNIRALYGDGGYGKSTAMTEAATRQLEKRPPSRLKVYLWSAYDSHLAGWWQRAESLRPILQKTRPVPAPLEDLADGFLKEEGDDPSKYPRPEAKAKAVAKLLKKNRRWLLIDGCEHWHDSALPAGPVGFRQTNLGLSGRTHPFISTLLAELKAAGDRFKGKLLITHRRPLPELGRTGNHPIPDWTAEEIHAYFTAEGLPTGVEFVRLLGLVNTASSPLVWRAIVEWYKTAEEVDLRVGLADIIEVLKRTLDNPNEGKVPDDPRQTLLRAAIRGISQAERKRSNSYWSLTSVAGEFNRPVRLSELGVGDLRRLSVRVPNTDAGRERLGKRLARTGLFTLESIDDGEWEFGAHQEVREACAWLWDGDREERRQFHERRSQAFFDHAGTDLPPPAANDPPQPGEDEPRKDAAPKLTHWLDLFTDGVFHASRTTPADAYYAIRKRFWEGTLAGDDCRLVVEYDNVFGDYRVTSTAAAVLWSKYGQFPEVPADGAADRALFLSLYGLSSWHFGRLDQARAVYQLAQEAWGGVKGMLNLAESVRRIGEIDTVIGRLDGAVWHGEQAVALVAEYHEKPEAADLPQVRPKDMERIADGTLAHAYHFAGRRADAARLFRKHEPAMFGPLEHWSLVWWYWWASFRLDELRWRFTSSGLAEIRAVIDRWDERLRGSQGRYYSLDWELLWLVRGLTALAEIRATNPDGSSRSHQLKVAKEALERSESFARRCSQRPHTAGCYLALAEYHLLAGDWGKVEKEIAWAEAEALQGRPRPDLSAGMPETLDDGTFWTWFADATILRAELAIRRGDPNAAVLLDVALALVNRLGYLRRKPDLEALWALRKEQRSAHTREGMAKQADRHQQRRSTAAPAAEAESFAELKVPLTLEALRENMKLAKIAAGLSGKEIGLRMGYPEEAAAQNVNGLLNRSENPGLFTLASFASAVGCRLIDLINPISTGNAESAD